MTARTSSPSIREATLARFASLTGKATRYIEEGQRSPEMIEALLTSLQMFRDETLRMPESPNNRREHAIVALPIDAQNLLSTKLSSTFLDERTKDRFIRIYGVLYVGELYRFEWHYSAREKHGQSLSRRNIEHLLSRLGLPLTLDLNESDWVPPYDIPENRALLDQPSITMLRAPHYVKEVEDFPTEQADNPIHQRQTALAQQWKDRHTQLFVGELFTRKYIELRPKAIVRGFALHAGAWFPNWTLPKPK